MFFTLLKARLGYMFSGMVKQKDRKNKKGKKKSNAGIIILFVLLFLYVGIVFAAGFGAMLYGISTVLTEETYWVYFAFTAVIAFLLMTIGSVFTAKTQLYEAKDNELLLSMPVAPSQILATRILSLLLLNYIFEAVIAVPAAVVWEIAVGFDAAGLILFIAEFLLLGLLSLAVICALAFLIELITRKMKHKNIFTMVFSLAFFGAYMWFYMNIENLLDYLISNIDGLVSAIRTYIFPAYHLGMSIAYKNALSAVLYILCAVLPFALVYFILSKSFIRLATATRRGTRVKYREKEMKPSGAKWALVKKEIKCFVSLPVYMMNCGLGLLLSLVVSVIAVVKSDFVFSLAGEMELPGNMMNILIVFVLLFLCSMNIISASSISLEGKRLWILKSVPVLPSDIMMSKVEAHCLICLPFTALSGVIVWAGLGMPWYIGALAVLVPSLYTVLIAFIGVLINLKLPKLEWANEAVPVKQGMATLLTMLSGFGIAILVAVPGFLVSFFAAASALYLGVVGAVLAGLAALFWYITKTCTAKAFMLLGEE